MNFVLGSHASEGVHSLRAGGWQLELIDVSLRFRLVVAMEDLSNLVTKTKLAQNGVSV